MKEIRVTKSQARRFLVRYHGFFGRRKSGKAGVMDVFGRLHSIQYDPLDVVTRNADLVLQARVPDYRPPCCRSCCTRITRSPTAGTR